MIVVVRPPEYIYCLNMPLLSSALMMGTLPKFICMFPTTSIAILLTKNTLQICSLYKKYPSLIFQDAFRFFSKYQKYPSLFFIIPQIPSLKLRLFHPEGLKIFLLEIMFCPSSAFQFQSPQLLAYSTL